MKNLEFSIITPALIGDTILPEPALSALSQRVGKKVSLSGVLPELKFLYQHNPYIELTDVPGKLLESWPAMLYGHQHKSSMYQGFFDQVGIEYQGERLHYQYYPIPDHHLCRHICFIPWARSCYGHQGGKANLMDHDLSWWDRLADLIPDSYDLPGIKKKISGVYNLGGDYVPPFEKSINMRKSSLEDSCRFLRFAKVVVTVQTGICHVMEGMRTRNTIFLAPKDSWMVTDQSSPHCQTPILSIEKNGKMCWDEHQVLDMMLKMVDSYKE